MNYSYARALAEYQDPALQLAAIKTAGCDPVFNGDRISGRCGRLHRLRTGLKPASISAVEADSS